MSERYVYLHAEPGVWRVGFWTDGVWIDEPHRYRSAEEAAARVHYLNGGAPPVPVANRVGFAGMILATLAFWAAGTLTVLYATGTPLPGFAITRHEMDRLGGRYIVHEAWIHGRPMSWAHGDDCYCPYCAKDQRANAARRASR